jgi:hypothetical protein
LFDYESQFVDFDGAVVEEGFAFGDCGDLLVISLFIFSLQQVAGSREGRRTFS